MSFTSLACHPCKSPKELSMADNPTRTCVEALVPRRKKILPIEGDTQLVLAEWYEIIWTSNGDSLSQQGFFMRQSFKLCLLATPLLLNLHGTWCCTAPCGLVSCPSHPSLRSEGHHMSTVRSARQGHNPSLAGKSRFSFLSPPAHMAPGSAGFLMLPPGELEIRFFHVFFPLVKCLRAPPAQISIDWSKLRFQ